MADGCPQKGLVCDIETTAGAPGPPEHMHPSSSERFPTSTVVPA
jgi:hypothetical protein